ncbi:MAG: hypothetical protein DI603_15020 [Roseateles depolymerans]|uniref:Uncharacterized protein n=1 Tax=Roseateles depolymerans TaxID=76731 RepID=A0A2W5DIK6_9BURK|nr:MAG: hypothetical protein DI603_15020 [Roseateles depolymerans]
MKQEIKDISVQSLVAMPTSLWALITSLTLAQWIALVLGALQAAYLLRKWWREETEWGIKLRRLTGHRASRDSALPELEP